MPRLNGTGPMGYGPKTGRGLGNCGNGRGWGNGFGCGFGRFWRFGNKVSAKEEKEILEQDVEVLQEELKAVKERLSGLKGKK